MSTLRTVYIMYLYICNCLLVTEPQVGFIEEKWKFWLMQNNSELKENYFNDYNSEFGTPSCSNVITSPKYFTGTALNCISYFIFLENLIVNNNIMFSQILF